MRLTFFITLILLVLTSCSSYKLKFVKTDGILKDQLDEAFLEYLEKDQLYLSFMSFYENYHMKLIQNNNILYDSLITTTKGDIAETFVVKENSDITIYFEGFKEPLIIKKEYLTNYKFVFIYKQRRGGILVEFNNDKVGK